MHTLSLPCDHAHHCGMGCGFSFSSLHHGQQLRSKDKSFNVYASICTPSPCPVTIHTTVVWGMGSVSLQFVMDSFQGLGTNLNIYMHTLSLACDHAHHCGMGYGFSFSSVRHGQLSRSWDKSQHIYAHPLPALWPSTPLWYGVWVQFLFSSSWTAFKVLGQISTYICTPSPWPVTMHTTVVWGMGSVSLQFVMDSFQGLGTNLNIYMHTLSLACDHAHHCGMGYGFSFSSLHHGQQLRSKDKSFKHVHLYARPPPGLWPCTPLWYGVWVQFLFSSLWTAIKVLGRFLLLHIYIYVTYAHPLPGPWACTLAPGYGIWVVPLQYNSIAIKDRYFNMESTSPKTVDLFAAFSNIKSNCDDGCWISFISTHGASPRYISNLSGCC